MPKNDYEDLKEFEEWEKKDNPVTSGNPYLQDIYVPPSTPYDDAGEDAYAQEFANQYGTGKNITGFVEDMTGETSLPGWYRPGSYVNPGYSDVYTGAPMTTQERDYILDFYSTYGYRPSALEASAWKKNVKGANTIYEESDYMPGSTLYEMGFRKPEDYYTAQSAGLTYGAYPGKSVPAGGGQVVLNSQGNPYLRFPTSEAARESGYQENRFAPPEEQAKPKPFAAPPLHDIRQHMEENPQDAYLARVADYLLGLYPDAVNYDKPLAENEDMKKFNEAKNRIEQAMAAGIPYTSLPYYKESLNTVGGQTQAWYQDYVMKYPEMVKQSRMQWESSMNQPSETGWGGAAGGSRPPSPDPTQLAINAERPKYEAWVGTLQMDEKNRIWMMQNYPALVQMWMTYGKGRGFVDWAKEYLRGQIEPPKSNSRRFAPATRYR